MSYVRIIYRDDDDRRKSGQGESEQPAPAAHEVLVPPKESERPESDVKRRNEIPVAVTDPLRRTIRQLLIDDSSRSAALSTGNQNFARIRLGDVVGDLNKLLDSVVDALAKADARGNRMHTKSDLPNLLALSAARTLPLEDIAELLDVPHEQVDIVLHDLRRFGGLTPDAVDGALSQIQNLRAELQNIVTEENHALLDKLVSLIGQVALAISVAVASGTLAASVVDGSAIDETIKGIIAGLVAIVLNTSASALVNRQRQRNPYVVARSAHDRLLRELRYFRDISADKKEAYSLETTVMQTRMLVVSYLTRSALLEIEWPGKHGYWLLLDQIDDSIGLAPVTRSQDLARLQRRLDSFHLPQYPPSSIRTKHSRF